MFDSCQTSIAGPKCSEVAEKIVQLFGWRQTYNVEKLQRNVPGRATTRISITRPEHVIKTLKEVRKLTKFIQFQKRDLRRIISSCKNLKSLFNFLVKGLIKMISM